MILQALTRYYEDLLSRGEIAAPGWAPAKISLALYINENGELTQIVPTMVEGTKGKKTVMQPQLMVEMSRNVQSGNTQNLKSTVIQRSFPKWSVAERRKTAAASDQAAVCACAHSRYFAGGSPSGLRV